MNPYESLLIIVSIQGGAAMEGFHEINILTSRGDINGALSLISKWSVSNARRIMKKGGYSVTPHAGCAFWTWV